jgi:large subunit ribosomal protein L21
MYAVVKSGGKQYRVEEGTVFEVDRLNAEAGDKVTLEPVMFSGDEVVLSAEDLEKIKIEAKVTEHLRGDKIKVFKYKAKKGYSRRSGHRAELTRLEVTSLGGAKKKAAPKKKAEAPKAETGNKTEAASAKKEPAKKPAAKKPAAKKETEGTDGA